MVRQRVYGAKQVKSDYILFLDDDVSFEPDFINKMAKPIMDGLCEVTVPPQFGMLPPERGMRKIIPMITLSAVPTIFNKDIYVKILKSGGWSYSRFGSDAEKYLYTESAVGIGFLTSKKAFLDIDFDKELWLEDTKYALPDDQVMFYKYVCCGYKIICVTDAEFIHLDAGSSSPERSVDASYAMGRNKYIFWYKFIYKRQKNLYNKLLSKCLINYSDLMQKLYLRISGQKEEYKSYSLGRKDGKRYVKVNGR